MLGGTKPLPNPLLLAYYQWDQEKRNSELILGLRPANERRRCKVTLLLIGWAQT